MKMKNPLSSALFIAVFALVACLVVCAIGRYLVKNRSGNWQLEKLPDAQQPDHFILGEGHTAYVRTTEGKLYGHHLFYGQDISWFEIEEDTPEKSRWGNAFGHCAINDSEINDFYKIQNPTGKIVDQIDCLYRLGGDGGGGNFRFVILDNDELWKWQIKVMW